MPPVTPHPLPLLETATAPPAAGERYWRSLEQLLGEPVVAEQLTAEFPMLAEAMARYDRRSFLRILGASLALAGITSTGCRRWPVEELRPHASRPAGFAPGVAEHYATLFELGGTAHSILAKSYDGRPIKIEGNPDHPASRGAASGLAQASLLDLYDPDRSRGIVYRGQPTPATTADPAGGETPPASGAAPGLAEADLKRIEPFWKPTAPRIAWEQFSAIAGGIFAGHRARQGKGLAILTESSSSPTRQRWIGELKEKLPGALWFTYEPIDRDTEWAGIARSYGKPLRPHYDLARAQLIVCVHADPLGLHPNHLQHARDWASGRDALSAGRMNRVVCIEPSWTVTGSVADTRIPLKPSLCEFAVVRIAEQLGIAAARSASTDESLDQELLTRLDAVASELRQAGTGGVVIGGAGLSAQGNQLVCAINEAIGANGSTVRYTEEPLADPVPQGYGASLQQLGELLQGNVIQTLVMVGGNPVYDAPADVVLDLQSTPERPLVSIHLSLHDNETSRASTWHVPMAHGLETWSDGRTWDGTYTIGQPLIEPLFGGKSPVELLALVGGQDAVKMRDEIRKTFDSLFPDDGNRGWEQAVHDGLREDSAFAAVALTAAQIPADRAPAPSDEGQGFEVEFSPDSSVYDGRFANNAWLQELPDPISKLTWENAAWISPADAQALKLKHGQVIGLEGAVEIPVMIMPGQARGCITLPLGYGRTQAGRVGNGVGTNVYPLRPLASRSTLRGAKPKALGRHVELATTQLHNTIPSIADVALQSRLGERGQAGLVVHETTLEEYLHDSHATHGDAHLPPAAPLFDQPASMGTPHRWAMTVDLNKCIGCNGCVVACQAENNIPVVGKENVLVNREMHWIRIDRYFKGSVDDPDVVHMPVACAHCENAPCEQVCPVAATLHDAEGTNTMIYNRCIGTRYCANNCPYKVRRFNYFDYHASNPREPAKPWLGLPDEQLQDEVSTLKKMVHNPDVTVRMRGVMEKCTYCIQRITSARITAKNEFASGQRESDLVRDGELQTACQSTCPTQAILFGDLNDAQSQVSLARSGDRNYELLAELNLGARTTYLAKIRNRPS